MYPIWDIERRQQFWNVSTYRPAPYPRRCYGGTACPRRRLPAAGPMAMTGSASGSGHRLRLARTADGRGKWWPAAGEPGSVDRRGGGLSVAVATWGTPARMRAAGRARRGTARSGISGEPVPDRARFRFCGGLRLQAHPGDDGFPDTTHPKCRPHPRLLRGRQLSLSVNGMRRPFRIATGPFPRGLARDIGPACRRQRISLSRLSFVLDPVLPHSCRARRASAFCALFS